MSVASRSNSDHLARRAVAVFAVVLYLAFPSACVAATQIDPRAWIARTGPSPAIPRQGLYEGCAPGTTPDICITHLTRIRAAGFRYVLNYSSWYGSAEGVLRYADAAAALGLQLIWPLNHPAWRGLDSLNATYPDIAAGRGALSNPDFAVFAVSLVANHPATWGFYIGDEVPPTETGSVAALSATVRRLAPDRPQLYVARPGAALLAPFAAFADVAGVDSYPVGSHDPPIRHAARTAQTVAAEVGAQTAMVLQAFSWSQYRPTANPARYPNAHNLRAMRDVAIRNADPSLILWYSYQDILRSDRPRQRWCELVWAAFSPVRQELRLRSCA